MSTFRHVRSGFAVSRHVVRKTSSQIDPLITKVEEQQKSGGSIDPSRFMTRKQKKAWRRLTPAKRRQYIRRAEKEVQRGHAKQGVAFKREASALPSRELTADPETARQIAGWGPGRGGYGKTIPALRRLRFRKEKDRIRREEEKKRQTPSSANSNTSPGQETRNTGMTDNGISSGDSGSGLPSQVNGSGNSK